ncbi:MAG: DUF3592 domain-containing protein [Candidatus Omnitrophica bacterium]|nr:DUF3592 domain-containing protein [Candidatus Omnitrophota bacterium]
MVVNKNNIYQKEKILEARMKTSPIVIIFFLLFAIVMFSVGIPRYLKTKKFIDDSFSTSGIISEIEKESRKTRAGTTKITYYVIYTFLTKNGEEIKGKSSVPRGPSDFKISDQITILYDPDNPNNSKMNTFSDLWMDSFCLNLLGIFLIISSVVVSIQYKKYISRRPI